MLTEIMEWVWVMSYLHEKAPWRARFKSLMWLLWSAKNWSQTWNLFIHQSSIHPPLRCGPKAASPYSNHDGLAVRLHGRPKSLSFQITANTLKAFPPLGFCKLEEKGEQVRASCGCTGRFRSSHKCADEDYPPSGLHVTDRDEGKIRVIQQWSDT